MNAENSDGSPAISKRRPWIILVAGAAILILAAAGVMSIFGGSNSPTENAGETTANFADLNAVDADENESSADRSSADMNATDMNATTEADASWAPSDWDYSKSFDQVRNAIVYYASVQSENVADFDFPYQGGSKLTMTVRWHPKYGQEVIFKISKGQFVCGVEECSGAINFGSGARSISLSEPTDNSSDTLFVGDSSDVIEQLKNTKRVVVELPFYQEGNRQFTFEMTNSLAWPPKGAEAKALATEDDNSVSD